MGGVSVLAPGANAASLNDTGAGVEQDHGTNLGGGRHGGGRRIRAAQYVRMSTDHQKYSTENQAAAIAVYAERRGYEIVRTYADAGKSGLSLGGRDEIKRLLADVRSGRADFAAVLVYDVSRWGRFQDADEAAAHEYACKSAGIAVHYCAEQFENDGSLPAAVFKSVKRAMAAAYSQDLSAKVFLGQCRLVRLGFRQGGPPGYGLRRRLVDEHRSPKTALSRGERKGLQTDRVILVPGPPEEVATVRRIYALFVSERRGEAEIAAVLNAEGVATDLGRPWTRGTVHQVLTNEKYAGHNVYNRVSRKLTTPRVANPPEAWVRAEHAFDPLVDADVFAAAQALVAARVRHYSDEEMLDRLAALLRAHGRISGILIDEADDTPPTSAYVRRFGSLRRAYELVGYTPGRDYVYVEVNRALRRLHPEVVAEVVARIEGIGGSVAVDPRTNLLRVNDEFTVSVAVSRCERTPAGSLRWLIRLDAGLRPDITVAVRMDAENRGVRDYYLLPALGSAGSSVRLREDNGVFLDAFRFDALDQLFRMAARVDVRSAA